MADRDYWAEIDARCPRWIRASSHVVWEGQPRVGWTHAHEDSGPRNMFVKGPGTDAVEFTMPFFRYVRGVDPSGNLHPITVSTCRDDSDDNTGYDMLILKRKRAAGWLIAEPDETHRGMEGQEYGKFLFDEMARRQKKHAQKMAVDADKHKSETAKQMETMNAALASRVADESSQMEKLVTMLADKLSAGRAR